jgi:DNA gyrase subunit A
LHLADHPNATIEDIVQFVQGPDFPTGGIIFDKKAILEAYATGRGPILTRGVADVVEAKKGDAQIIITAIPYQVSKAGLVAKMAELVRDKKIEGIRDIRDESDKEGMRVVIYLRPDSYPQKIVNALYKYTELERSFHVNLLALDNGIQPEVMSLKTLLEAFLNHRKVVVERRTRFDLERAKERAHILEGLVKALDHIDAVIKTIRQSKDRAEAQTNLIKRFDLSEPQAHAILEMRLSALANLEAQKIKDELKEKQGLASRLTALLKDPGKMLAVVKEEFKEIKEKYGDQRRTAVRAGSPKEIGVEDIVPEEEAVVVLTRGGYIKRMNPELYRAQNRGGKGVIGVTPKEEDLVEHFVTANTHANLLFFTDAGKVYQTKAYEIPEGTRQARGKPLVGFLQIAQNERVTALLDYLVKPAKTRQESPVAPRHLVMATKRGVIKKTPLEDFANVRRNGLIALSLKKGDFLGWAKGSSGQDEVMLVTKKGQAIRFNEREVRPMGRTATGVGGIGLKADDAVVGMTVISQGPSAKTDLSLLVLTEHGYGKKTPVKSYRKQRRAGMGIKTAQTTAKTGLIVAARLLDPSEEDLIAVSQRGQVIRVALSSVPKLGRQTQGVRIMKLDDDDVVASATCV